MYVNVYLFSCATYLAACSLTTRCDKALAASHCLSRDQRPTTLDVCTYSAQGRILPSSTSPWPRLWPHPPHTITCTIRFSSCLSCCLSLFLLSLFLLATINPILQNWDSPSHLRFSPSPSPAFCRPGPAANDAAATPLSSVNRPCVYKVSINVPLHPKPPAWLFPTYINTPSLSPASYTMSATYVHASHTRILSSRFPLTNIHRHDHPAFPQC